MDIAGEIAPRAPGSVYQTIKQMILSGTYRAGNKLVHDDVARALNVSRTPVREAFERLGQEGFLTHVPRRGYFVSEVDEEEAMNLYGIREALEMHALRCTFEAAGRVDTSRLREIHERYRGAVADRSAKTRLQVDAEFHVALAEQSGNAHLVQLLGTIFDRMTLKMRTDAYELRLGEEALEEHACLMTAFESGDEETGERLLRQHIAAARGRLLEQMRQWA